MANTSTTINSFDELIIKAISVMRKSQKRPDETRIYDSIKIFLENFDIDASLFWERMKYLEENKVIYNFREDISSRLLNSKSKTGN